MTVLDAALELHAHGYSVLPIRPDGTKAPALKDWRRYMSERPTTEQLYIWFPSREGAGGPDLGVVQGAISGHAELAEIEGRAAHHLPGLRDLAHDSGAGDLWDRLASGWTELSPSGGYHFHYRVEGMEVPGNQKLATRPATADELLEKPGERIKTLAETRGEGGQVVAAPSRHHETGRAWLRLTGGPATAPTLTPQERETFHDLLRTLHEDAPEQAAQQHEAHPGTPGSSSTAGLAEKWQVDGPTPGDDYEARTDWADILQPHGWTLVHTSGRVRYWRRPEKAIGVSATTGKAADRDRLYVFTTSTHFQAETPYTKFGAYALLNHGGNHSEAARELARQGYGRRPPALADVLATVQPQTAPTSLAAAVQAEQPTQQHEEGPWVAPGAWEAATPAAATSPEPPMLEKFADAITAAFSNPGTQQDYTLAAEGSIGYGPDDAPTTPPAAPAPEAPPASGPPSPTEQRIEEETARLLIQREARKRLEVLERDAAPSIAPPWVDAGPLLDGTYDPPLPTIGTRLASGLPLLYASAVNGLVGDPEAAKTLLASALAVDTMLAGGTVAWLDLDHNGAPATIARLRRFGATRDHIERQLRLALPEDQLELDAVIHDLVQTPATLVVIDSVGELLPLYGASSNDADEYTRVHQQVMAKAARAGAAVLTIDHLSKGTDSRTYGASGTIAKKRAYDGALIRVTVDQPFAIGRGGTSDLRIIKDRHSGLRSAATGGGREPLLARFILSERENAATSWKLQEPGSGIGEALVDVDALAELVPPPSSVRDIKGRLGWGTERAASALKSWRELKDAGAM